MLIALDLLKGWFIKKIDKVTNVIRDDSEFLVANETAISNLIFNFSFNLVLVFNHLVS